LWLLALQQIANTGQIVCVEIRRRFFWKIRLNWKFTRNHDVETTSPTQREFNVVLHRLPFIQRWFDLIQLSALGYISYFPYVASYRGVAMGWTFSPHFLSVCVPNTDTEIKKSVNTLKLHKITTFYNWYLFFPSGAEPSQNPLLVGRETPMPSRTSLHNGIQSLDSTCFSIHSNQVIRPVAPLCSCMHAALSLSLIVNVLSCNFSQPVLTSVSIQQRWSCRGPGCRSTSTASK